MTRAAGCLMVILLLGCSQPDASAAGADASGGGASVQEMPDLRSARVTLESWVTLWNSYDLDQVDVLFTEDESVTYFSSETEGLIKGHAALMEHHEGFGFVPGGKQVESRLWLEDIRLDAAGTGAVATAIWFFQRTPSDDEVMRGPVTFVLAPAEDGYRIQHANFSNY